MPHSWQVRGIGSSLRKAGRYARLGAKKVGSGAERGGMSRPFRASVCDRHCARPAESMPLRLRAPLLWLYASQPATEVAACRQIGPLIARWLVSGRVMRISPSCNSTKSRFAKREVARHTASQQST